MNTTARILAALVGTSALAIPALIPEGWGPVAAGAGIFATGMAIAIFGNE